MLLVALFLARYSWETPFNIGDQADPDASQNWTIPGLSDAERSLYDVRALIAAPASTQDQRILVIVYNDQTLIKARKRSPLDRGILAKTLRNIDAMGAKAIGIDMLFDQEQDEDADLVAALRGMKTPTFVGYAAVKDVRYEENIIYEQQQFLDGFMDRLKGSNARPASIRLDNANGITRNWPPMDSSLPQALSRAMVGVDQPALASRFDSYVGAMRYHRPSLDSASVKQPIYTYVPIDLFTDPALAANFADQVRGRYVLIGGDIVDTDRLNTTLTSATGEPPPPGIEGHAEMIAQMLDGKMPQRLPGWVLTVLAVFVIAAAAMTSLLEVGFLRLLPFVLLQLLVFGGLPFLIEMKGMDSQFVPAVGWALGWIVAFSAVGSAARASGAVQRNFAQSALGKYLPRDIAKQIIDNPELLSLHGTNEHLYILFSDLEGFTQMSSQIQPEKVAVLLNDYLDSLSQVVLDHGGVIDKYVGDAIVAFWGAPIARPDDGEKAARAGLALHLAGEDFRVRHSGEEGVPPIGKTRVGLHYGDAVVGNFGGEGRIQYTALGDAMNTASRLESANKSLDSGVMASREFAERSGLDWWRPMGRVKLRGRDKPVELFEPAPDFPADDRAALSEALDMLDSNKPEAVRRITVLAGKHLADKALQNLLLRLGKITKDGVYVLG